MNTATTIVKTLRKRTARQSYWKTVGRIKTLSQTKIIAELHQVKIGELCNLVDDTNGKSLLARVVAISGNEATLAPLGNIDQLSNSTKVYPTGSEFTFACSNALLGHILDGQGKCIDDENFLNNADSHNRAVAGIHINPLNRPPIDTVFRTGVRSIDGLNTLGEGQRVGLFGEPGSGKSSLLGSLARNADFDVCVLALIGERGREVREFLERQLPPEFRSRCVVIVSTSDTPAMQRILGGHIAVSVAEYFRDQGKSVLLLFDSVTRFARAIREVGLAAGEVAVRKGYPPSVYTELPNLIERCGRTNEGSITTILTVLTENNGEDDPIAEEVRSLTDGHILLSTELGNRGHYPAVDVLKSRSRLMNELVTPSQVSNADKVRGLLSKYLELELLIQVGEYRRGGDAFADESIDKRDRIEDFLKQDAYHKTPWNELLSDLESICQ